MEIEKEMEKKNMCSDIEKLTMTNDIKPLVSMYF